MVLDLNARNDLNIPAVPTRGVAIVDRESRYGLYRGENPH